jgi:alkaline phosphatase D
MALDRRNFLTLAAAMGASAAFGCAHGRPSKNAWREQRERFPQGVASGDPAPESVLLWTRCPVGGARRARLTVEVAEDESFRRVVAAEPVAVEADSDWTCRVLVGGLRARTTYWYRFLDADGNGSRIGRTRTAPKPEDDRPVAFAFASCQNANQGAQNAYRRMIYDDAQKPADEQLGFVLHLGDFIYEIVWYPEDRPQGMYDRRLRDIVRYAHGEKIRDFHVPTTLADYRAIYCAYLADPDLQDARARWPFVAMWDNHEFSWLGWQSLQKFGDDVRPAQTVKVAANQAWFEYQPARVGRPGKPRLGERFDPPQVVNTPIEHFDAHDLGQEPNNLAAIRSLTGYRALRYGRHVDLVITDQHSYSSREPTGRVEAKPLVAEEFPDLLAEEVMEILDGGSAYAEGKPPETIRFGKAEIPNFRRAEPPSTLLGADQKAWFLDRLRRSGATWKVWGNSLGTLDFRVDPQNLPADFPVKWPGKGYACFGGGGDYGTTYRERAEIYDTVRDAGIAGFVTVSGDRHSFWAGLSAKSLPPKPFEPVGVAFITGSISAPGIPEAFEHRYPRESPLRPLYLVERPGETKPQPTINLLLHHGVRSCLEYQKSGDFARARAVSNAELAPHLAFLDMGGHGYAILRAAADAVACEFVCIPRPLERAEGEDGGPVLYRAVHSAKRWAAGDRPRLEQRVTEGVPPLST